MVIQRDNIGMVLYRIGFTSSRDISYNVILIYVDGGSVVFVIRGYKGFVMEGGVYCRGLSDGL